jgi:hypothetical protein
MSNFIDKAGYEGYGIYWAILEVIGTLMTKENGWKTSATYPLTRWATLLQLHRTTMSKYMGYLRVTGLMLVTYSGDTMTVDCPNLLKYKDEYSKKSGHTPDIVRTHSGQTPRQETETKVETKIKKDIYQTTTTNLPARAIYAENLCGEIVVDSQKNENRVDQEHVSRRNSYQDFFCRHYPSRANSLMTVKFSQGLNLWSESGVTVEDANEAFEYCAQTGKIDKPPEYLIPIALKFCHRRKKFGGYDPALEKKSSEDQEQQRLQKKRDAENEEVLRLMKIQKQERKQK